MKRYAPMAYVALLVIACMIAIAVIAEKVHADDCTAPDDSYHVLVFSGLIEGQPHRHDIQILYSNKGNRLTVMAGACKYVSLIDVRGLDISVINGGRFVRDAR